VRRGGTCHIGTANDKNNKGSISVAFPSGLNYIPGVKQHLTVTIADPATTQQTWGFQLTARTSSPTTMAGSFAYTDSNTALICAKPGQPNQPFEALCLGGVRDSCTTSPAVPSCPTGFTLQYIEHSLTGYTKTQGTGSASYSFDWTPPATNAGNVVVYVAGNAGLGGNPTNMGSHIYTTTYTLAPQSFGGVPSISANGVISAGAFGGYTNVAPGSWMEIYGANLAATTRGWAGADFTGTKAPTLLDGVKVTIGGQPAFIDFVSPGQVNAQVPSNVPAGAQTMTVTTPAGTSSTYPITVNALQPGMLAPPQFAVNNKQYVAALFPDSTANGPFVLPPTAIPGVPARYAKPGDTIIIYGVGFGPVKDSGGQDIPAGTIVTAANTLANPLTITIGGQAATLGYQGLAPNFVGLYQFNVVVPNIANNDLAPLTYTLNGTAGPQTLYVAVHN